MSHTLFAFKVSKVIEDLPEIDAIYDPEQQVAVWHGNQTVLAVIHCSWVPFSGKCCYIDPWGSCGMYSCTPHAFNNAKCDA